MKEERGEGEIVLRKNPRKVTNDTCQGVLVLLSK